MWIRFHFCQWLVLVLRVFRKKMQDVRWRCDIRYQLGLETFVSQGKKQEIKSLALLFLSVVKVYLRRHTAAYQRKYIFIFLFFPQTDGVASLDAKSLAPHVIRLRHVKWSRYFFQAMNLAFSRPICPIKAFRFYRALFFCTSPSHQANDWCLSESQHFIRRGDPGIAGRSPPLTACDHQIGL